MKASYLRQYVKAETGNTVYVYTVDGTPEELAQYKSVQGSNYIEDRETGSVLWFTTKFAMNKCTLMFNQDGTKVFADMSEIDRLASLANQTGGAVGEALAQQVASMILGKAGANVPTPQAQPAQQEPEQFSEDLGEL
jgi:hypothetical protein